SARDFGGGEKHLVDLCRGLQARGHEIFVALRPTNRWQEKFDFIRAENFLHVSIRNSFGIFSAQRIAEFVRENDIRIIHAHVARDYIPASLACRIAKTPKLVLTRHVLFPMKPFHKFALKNVSKVIAVSGAVAENLEAVFPKQKITIVPNGIEIEKWSGENHEKLRREFRSEHDISFDALLIGTIGELKILKVQRDFVLAAKIVAEKFPDAHFVIVGRDNSAAQSFRSELKRLVKVFNLENRFLWLDWVEETAPLLHALDVFVSPSHSESFGLAIVEAMASAAAIAAAETEGAKEILQDGETGLIVPVQDPVALAEAISRLLNDENLRAKLGKQAQEFAGKNFSSERMIEETDKVYKQL
ncbi:MAG TPA: glycosyltransferase family 4 protein, partial [Pyrinomonadaceae bacterium]|nr:glycosyltransferase family 4 protein [Pyrinomonadaceae bacterium]